LLCPSVIRNNINHDITQEEKRAFNALLVDYDSMEDFARCIVDNDGTQNMGCTVVRHTLLVSLNWNRRGLRNS
jgi:hypothetical protein